MADPSVDRSLFRAFAEMLEYPHASPLESARACAALLAPVSPEAAALVDEFAAVAERTPYGDLQEAYTRTFDLNATYCPYVGYHLFGESYKRSVLLVRLKTQYRAVGVETGSEIPDHLALVLRFLAASGDADLTGEVIVDALLPALGRMVRGAGAVESCDHDAPPDPVQDRQIYHGVLEALRLLLAARGPSASPDDSGERPVGDREPSATG